MTTDEEIVAIAIRSESELAESAARGVDWLDTQRHLLVEYSEQDRHTIPLTGTPETVLRLWISLASWRHTCPRPGSGPEGSQK